MFVRHVLGPALSALALVAGAQPTLGPAVDTAAAPSAKRAGTEAANADGVDNLLRSARLWLSLERPELARPVLEKVLAVQAAQPQALLLLAELELRNNRLQPAQRVLQVLQRSRPDSPEAREAQALARVYGPQREQLAWLRLLRRGGNTVGALALAHQLFPDGQPPGELAVELAPLYAAEPGGAARMQRLLAQRIANGAGGPRERLALAELQAQDAATLHQALHTYAELAAAREVPPQRLLDPWRRALERLQPGATAQSARERFAQAFPQVELPALAAADGSAAATPPAPADRAREQGLQALQANRLDAAESLLRRSLTLRPGDARTLGALGLLRLREGRHEDAAAWFSKAQDAAGRDAGQRARWSSFAAEAWHWAALAQARALRDAGRLDEAADVAARAQATQPREPEAQLLLGSLREQQGDVAAAEALYRGALRGPEAPRAREALAALLARSGRAEEALQAAAAGAPAPSPGSLRDAAEALQNQRGFSAALRLLERSITVWPQDPWLRFDLAGLYRALRLPELALEVMAEGRVLAPRDAAMRYAGALVSASLDRDAEALALLDGIAPAERSPAMDELQLRLRFEDALTRARTALARGDREDAVRWRVQAAVRLGDEPDRRLRLARAAAAAGAQDEALALLQPLREAPAPSLPLSVALGLAQALADAGDDASAQALVQAQLARADWTPALAAKALSQQEELAGRRIARHLAAGNVGRARAAALGWTAPPQSDKGLLAEARARLLLRANAPQLALAQRPAEMPSDPARRLLWARVMAANGFAAQALALARQAQDALAPDDVDHRLTALRLASVDRPLARQWTQALLAQHPRHAGVRLEAARQAELDGHWEEALAQLRAVQALGQEAGQGDGPPVAAVDMRAAAPTGAPALPPAGNGDVATAQAPMPGLSPSDVDTPGEPAEATAPAVPDSASDGLTAFAGGVPLLRPRGPAAVHSDPAASSSGPAAVVDADDMAAAAGRAAAIEARREPRWEAGLFMQGRNATPGQSSLSGVEIPLQRWWPEGYAAHRFVQLDAVRLDAGALPAAAPDETDAVGRLLALRPGGLGAPLAQQARGLHMAIGHVADTRRWDLGLVGLGFEVPNVVGGWRERVRLGGADVDLEFSRRVQTSTLLSYAGQRDPATGAAWGGVTANTLGLRSSVDLPGRWSGSASVRLGAMAGRQVQLNPFAKLRVALDRDWIDRPGLQLSAGPVFNAWGFRHDASFFSWGHGGYYSPQRYFSLGLPVQLQGVRGRWSFNLRAGLTRSWTREDDAPYYPTDAALQTAAGNPLHAGGHGGGWGYSLRLTVELQLDTHWRAGVFVNADRSAYYAPTQAMVYVRRLLSPQGSDASMQPRPVQPYTQL